MDITLSNLETLCIENKIQYLPAGTVERETKRYKYWNKTNQRDFDVSIEWTKGGISGGSCWGGEPKYSRSGDNEPEFTQLDLLLEKILPTITFLQYKKLVSSIVKYSEYTLDEYYGNSTDYGVKSFNLVDLAEYLSENF